MLALSLKPGTWISESFPPFPTWVGCLFFLNFPNSMFHAKHLLSFWESEISVHARQRVPMWPAPKTALRHCVSHELPWYVTFHMSCCDFLLEAQVMWLYWERTRRSLPWFPPDVTQGTFPPGSSGVINLSLEDDCMLSPLGPSGDSPKARVVLGHLKQWWQPWDTLARRPWLARIWSKTSLSKGRMMW